MSVASTVSRIPPLLNLYQTRLMQNLPSKLTFTTLSFNRTDNKSRNAAKLIATSFKDTPRVVCIWTAMTTDICKCRLSRNLTQRPARMSLSATRSVFSRVIQSWEKFWSSVQLQLRAGVSLVLQILHLCKCTQVHWTTQLKLETRPYDIIEPLLPNKYVFNIKRQNGSNTKAIALPWPG